MCQIGVGMSMGKKAVLPGLNRVMTESHETSKVYTTSTSRMRTATIWKSDTLEM